MQGYGGLTRLRGLMKAAGARRLVVKRLADNDNSKNQVYLGPSFSALNLLPFGNISRDDASSTILKAPVRLSWLLDNGELTEAPGAQVILYPQYPEVRLSGFLRGAEEAPNEIMNRRQSGRLLLLGIAGDGRIIAAVVAPDDVLAAEVETNMACLGDRLLYELAVDLGIPDTRGQLLKDLARIHSSGWIDSKRLRPDGSVGPCQSTNCGGYTLEAELGVRPNSYSEPDYLGWEVKQYGVRSLARHLSAGPVTLMTPEPTGGFYKEKGVEHFLRTYGYADKLGREDRINFGGAYRVGVKVASTRLTLVLDGYDAVSGKLIDPARGVALIDERGNAAAVWSYSSLIQHWARKHGQAVYVPTEASLSPTRRYRFGNLVLLGEQTDFFRLLRALAAGHVYYDPGIKLEAASSSRPRTKRRSQFRIAVARLPSLYTSADFITLLN